MKRKFGIILPVFSLPSKYGIGSFGKDAYDFIDFLHESKVSIWQVLPLGPTSYGDSPYQSFSAFAGNDYFIDLDFLIDEGLLTSDEVAQCDTQFEDKIDYGKLFVSRFEILDKAAIRFRNNIPDDYYQFIKENEKWLTDFALFMSIKKTFGMISWLEWPEEYRLKDKQKIDQFAEDHKDLIDHYYFCQYEFFKQWSAVKEYANQKGIEIIGDVPFYVALDSSDVWGNRELFVLNEKGFPIEVAGVPPDYFSETGQLWGNPIYDWENNKKDLYKWWRSRIKSSGKLFDYIRIDHFRGLDSFWAVPAGRPNAIEGEWKIGPGIRFIRYLKRSSRKIQLIAEDLGLLTPSVIKMLKDSRLPGMKVLEFAFSSDEDNEYLPETYPENCVCYTGTHDNGPLKEWINSLDEDASEFMSKYLKKKGLNPGIDGLIRLGMSSNARIFMVQLQDFLETDENSRINTPGKEEGNWQWRVNPELLNNQLSDRISDLVVQYDRAK